MRSPLALWLIGVLTGVGCSSPGPYVRLGSPEEAFGTSRTAASMVGYPAVSVDIYYRGRQTGGWFGAVARRIGTHVDHGLNQKLYDRIAAVGIGEATRDAVGDAVEPILKRVSALTIRDRIRLPDPSKESTKPYFGKWQELDRIATDSNVSLYGTEGDRAVLKLAITLTYLSRTDGGLQVVWRDLFLYESRMVTRKVLEDEVNLGVQLVREGVKTLKPWISWELLGGESRFANKKRQTISMNSGAELTGHVLSRDGSHVVVRGDVGMVRAIPTVYIKSIEEPDE